MADDNQINSVNQHYLDKVMHLAESQDVKATEDIFDARGMKLVAKGAKISRALQERLLQRRLSKPFEASIAVEEGVDVRVIQREAESIIETVDPVRSVIKALNSGPSPIQVLSEIQFGSAISTMLTIIQRGGQQALSHSVMVSLLSIALARKRGLGVADQSVVALAGLLHDIGELYIEPAYLKSRRRLYPHEWRHVVVHPRIGQMLISGLEHYPAAVAQAVFEHHERLDGSGYPRRVSGNAISVPGQVVSVAELLSGVFMEKSEPLQRAELALKIIPGEHARELVSAVSSAMHEACGGRVPHAAAPTGEEQDQVRRLRERIGNAIGSAQCLADGGTIRSKRGMSMLQDLIGRAAGIQRAFISTGLDACIEGDDIFSSGDAQILFETAVATREIQWRLRDVARELSLQSDELDESDQASMQELIAVLDGERQDLSTAAA
ncbi:HD-GYP domain-containing protein [Noviherbaspirillum galbum]|uniref:HD domain-containing protein n=1 Tax=Noviherbaspirillum galbum TaxID=2709383 RepID=A0A6B3SS33_9BURK|nr:HD domain-containing phosphohydrolase [Noviherbaspirillum galbum]NEX61606.1 HD domain-containing protein [Noviherbaspirillum galbum]